MIFPIAILGICLFWYAGFILVNAIWWEKLKPAEFAENAQLPSLSVVIPARNEEASIRNCLEAVLQQNYPADKFEVILIDDHSEDQTLKIARELAQKYPALKVISLGESTQIAFKKAALALAIGQAKGDIILSTDADCIMSPDWARSIASTFQPETGLVSGPVRLSHGKAWLEKFQALEFMGLVAVGAASMQSGRPNLANGANLAFRKLAYQEVNGYAGIDNIASGDDELLMQKIASQTTWKAKFAFRPEAIVTTPAQTSWAKLKAQRIRWVSKSRHYKNKSMTIQLTVSWLAMWFFPATLVAGFWDGQYWMAMGVGFLLKAIADGIILSRASAFFGNRHLLKYLLPEEILHIPFLIWAGLAGNKGSYEWKGRKVK